MFRTASHHLARSIPPSSLPPLAHISDATPLHRFIERISTISHDANLHSNLVSMLNEEHDDCLEWAQSQFNLASRQSLSIDCAAARQAAQAGTLMNALLETCCYLKKYQPARTGDMLTDCIQPRHREYLISCFQSSFHLADEENQCRIVAAVEERALKNFGIRTEPLLHHRPWIKQTSPSHQAALSESELLALCDYVNSSTGIFNIVSVASRAEAYYGIGFFHNIIRIYTDTLNASLHKLQAGTDFGRRDITLFKGIHLGRLDGRFNLAHLEHAYHHGSLIAFPHPISGTTDQNESYANTKHEKGYLYELMLIIPAGADVDGFHDTHTRGQKEVIAPAGLRFAVTGKYQRAASVASTGSNGLIEGFKLTPVPH